MLASLRALVHSCKTPAVGSVRQTSHVFLTDLQRGADKGGHTNVNPLSQEKLSTNIRSHCPIFSFAPNLRGSECNRSKPFPLDLHMELNSRGASSPEFPICPLIDHRAVLPQHTPLVLVPQTCAGLVSEQIPVPLCSMLQSLFWCGRVLVPIVLVMMLTWTTYVNPQFPGGMPCT